MYRRVPVSATLPVSGGRLFYGASGGGSVECLLSLLQLRRTFSYRFTHTVTYTYIPIHRYPYTYIYARICAVFPLVVFVFSMVGVFITRVSTSSGCSRLQSGLHCLSFSLCVKSFLLQSCLSESLPPASSFLTRPSCSFLASS